MPFGLDLKSLIVGVLIAYFLVPWVMGLMSRGSASRSAPATA
jgi:antibiotic biosynthesis monooxygenase (ABM) superfamily enzyme